MKNYFDEELYRRFPRQYRLSMALHNNALLSYQYLSQSSLSLPEREDVAQFRAFVKKHLVEGQVLDVGCGSLPLPGYFSDEMLANSVLHGIDIMENPQFKGQFHQCFMENMPFPENYFDTIVCATSLDHCIHLKMAVKEIVRVMKSGGVCIIWNGEIPWSTKILLFLQSKVNPYYDYGEGLIFHIPKGAIDPFHKKHLSAQEIAAHFRKNKCRLIDRDDQDSNAFIALKKL